MSNFIPPFLKFIQSFIHIYQTKEHHSTNSIKSIVLDVRLEQSRVIQSRKVKRSKKRLHKEKKSA